MREIFEKLTGEWIAAVKAKDAAQLASMVTEDCVFLAPNGSPIRGREKVGQLYTTLFARFEVAQKFQIEEAQAMGDWAFGWGVDDITMTPVDGGPPARFVGHGVSILRRDADEQWRFARGINNATLQKS